MSAAQGELLTVDGVVAGYGAAEQILKGTSLRVAPGEIVCLSDAGVKHVCHIVAPLWVLRAVCWVSERLARLTGSLFQR